VISLRSTAFAAFLLLPHCTSPRPARSCQSCARPTQDEQVVRDHAESDPALHAKQAVITAASQAVATLEGADAPFRAGAPSQGRSHRPWAPFSTLPREHDGPDLMRTGDLNVGRRGEPSIGHGQARGPAEELFVPHQGRFPQRAIGDSRRADLVVGDELRLGFLDLN
jgi:hypothetical protein